MKSYLKLVLYVSRHHWRVVLFSSVGFLVLYYTGLLLLTMLRFGEIPNYVVFHPVFHVYGLVLSGTPSLLDAIPILLDEPWFETGYKNPAYYGVATWSFMLIPPKMLLVFFMGILLGIFTATIIHSKQQNCQIKTDSKLFAAAGVSSTFISLTSATLTWVVCCATPSWSVALAMLGMSASLALWLEPLGNVLTVTALVLMVAVIYFQLKHIMHSGHIGASHV
jgi:hypothetical protein